MPTASRSPDADPIAQSRPARTRTGPLVPLEKEAANDDLAPRSRASPERHLGPMLGEVIRELVRSEVQAELSRVIATTPPQPAHVSVAAYAAARSISVSTVRNAIRAGRLPAIRIGTAVRVPVDAEIGRPVLANADGRDACPVTRAEQILAERIARSLAKSTARQVA
jgi:excisionase family DNA binding protein